MSLEQIDLTKVDPIETANTVVLTKGVNIPLTKDEKMTVAAIGLGWDKVENGHPFDADVSALLINKDGKLIPNDAIVYFGGPIVIGSGDTKKTSSKCGGILHSGDNTTGEGDGDDETILVEVEEVDQEVDKIVFIVNIFDAKNRGNQTFGMSDNCSIRLYNPDTNEILASYDLTEDYSAADAIYAGELYKKNGVWKFKALGDAANGNINDLAAKYK